MVHVDPRFDVFRKLDPRETPPSIGQIFGEPRVLAVLPSAAPAAELQAWRELFKGWQSDSHAIEMKLDTEVAALPARPGRLDRRPRQPLGGAPLQVRRRHDARATRRSRWTARRWRSPDTRSC